MLPLHHRATHSLPFISALVLEVLGVGFRSSLLSPLSAVLLREFSSGSSLFLSAQRSLDTSPSSACLSSFPPRHLLECFPCFFFAFPYFGDSSCSSDSTYASFPPPAVRFSLHICSLRFRSPGPLFCLRFFSVLLLRFLSTCLWLFPFHICFFVCIFSSFYSVCHLHHIPSCCLARAVSSLLSSSRVFYATLVTLLQGCTVRCGRLWVSFSLRLSVLPKVGGGGGGGGISATSSVSHSGVYVLSGFVLRRFCVAYLEFCFRLCVFPASLSRDGLVGLYL